MRGEEEGVNGAGRVFDSDVLRNKPRSIRFHTYRKFQVGAKKSFSREPAERGILDRYPLYSKSPVGNKNAIKSPPLLLLKISRKCYQIGASIYMHFPPPPPLSEFSSLPPRSARKIPIHFFP